MTTQQQQRALTHTPPDAYLLEQVLVGGDLGKLSAPQRLDYYRRVCESLGLNPLTRPFEYITLNNKLVLYAGRNCTDQLRATRNVSVTIVARERMDDLYVVTARATTPDGRTDAFVGAVVLNNLKGDALANAIMRAETKAKRRVTLSICGLSWADESEVASIPNAQPVAVDLETGEILGTPLPATTPAVAAGREQLREMDAERKRLGWEPGQLTAYVQQWHGGRGPRDLTFDEAGAIINALAAMTVQEQQGV